MTKSIAIYIEGGGDRPSTLVPFRTGMSAFLKPIVDEVRSRRIRWSVIACGGRQQTYAAFVDAVEKEPEVLNVLLVDAEEPIAVGVSPWAHVRQRPGDGWCQPPGTDDTRCQMMVACMEAWFLADPAGLIRHYGGNFDASKLPPANLAESRTKSAIADALKKATRNTTSGEYRKIRDGAKLLQHVDPTEVRRHCLWCDRLFRELGDAIGAQI